MSDNKGNLNEGKVVPAKVPQPPGQKSEYYLIDKIIKWRGNVLAVMGRNRRAVEQNNGSIEIKR